MNAGPWDLTDFLQNRHEKQKARLVRILHDDLGGLLVGALMDLAWAELHSDSKPKDAREKMIRARQTLSSAVDLKRQLVEDLRPSLLDNVGLFAALRWLTQTPKRAQGSGCRTQVPDDELRLDPHASIVVFRSIQEVFDTMCTQGSVPTSLDADEDGTTLIVSLNGSGASAVDGLPRLAIERRLATVEGTLMTGSDKVTITAPLASIMARL